MFDKSKQNQSLKSYSTGKYIITVTQKKNNGITFNLGLLKYHKSIKINWNITWFRYPGHLSRNSGHSWRIRAVRSGQLRRSSTGAQCGHKTRIGRSGWQSGRGRGSRRTTTTTPTATFQCRRRRLLQVLLSLQRRRRTCRRRSGMRWRSLTSLQLGTGSPQYCKQTSKGQMIESSHSK